MWFESKVNEYKQKMDEVQGCLTDGQYAGLAASSRN